jgi:hypothetical protein
VQRAVVESTMRYVILIVLLLVGGAWVCFAQSAALREEHLRLDAIDNEERGFVSWWYSPTPDEEALDLLGNVLSVAAAVTGIASLAWVGTSKNVWPPYNDYDCISMLHLDKPKTDDDDSPMR